jgi:hypothetical protein
MTLLEGGRTFFAPVSTRVLAAGISTADHTAERTAPADRSGIGDGRA